MAPILIYERVGRLRDLGAAHLVECAAAELALHLANDRRRHNRCGIAVERHLVVRAIAELTVRRALRDLDRAQAATTGTV